MSSVTTQFKTLPQKMTSEILASNRRFIYHKPNFKTFNFLPVLKYDLSYYFIFWKGSLYTPDHAVLLMGGSLAWLQRTTDRILNYDSF